MLKPLRMAVAAILALTGAVVFAPTASAEVDVYSTPGYHTVNGREWYTECEPYSLTHRCRTEIMATVIKYVNGRFFAETDWAFNNLTYLSSPRSAWTTNPLAAFGVVGGKHAWTATDGRKWRTECDTALTGRNGCRSFIEASVIVPAGRGYQWVKKEIFNSMVRFGELTGPTITDPGIDDIPVVPIDPADVPAVIGAWTAIPSEGSIVYGDPNVMDKVVVVMAFGDAFTADDLAADLDHPQLFGAATCGYIPEEGEEACVFTSPKYGTVAAMTLGANLGDLQGVTAAVMEHIG